jgi:hypothetical protein
MPSESKGNVDAKHLMWVAGAIAVSVTVAVFLWAQSYTWNTREHDAIKENMKNQILLLRSDLCEIKADLKKLLEK